MRFNTQPPEGGCCFKLKSTPSSRCFNTQPPEGGCALKAIIDLLNTQFQHTATRRWLLVCFNSLIASTIVSTHSHPKVAAACYFLLTGAHRCFNTQPPEGGCKKSIIYNVKCNVSTHSHPKVAAS